MKMLNLLFFPVIMLFFLSCSDDDKTEPGNGATEIKTIQAVSCVDLTDRADWNLLLGYSYLDGKAYNYTLNGHNLNATSPKDEPYYYPEKTTKDYQDSEGPGEIYIRFASPDYLVDDNEAGKRVYIPFLPNIKDQSTAQKLFNADALFCKYTGTISSNLSGVKLIHENNFLDFYAYGFPNDQVEIKILDNKGIDEIIPYLKDEVHYNAIILSRDDATKISATTNGKTYTTTIDFADKRDQYHSFEVWFDEVKQELRIEKLKTAVWSEVLSLKRKEVAEFKLFIGSPEGPLEVSTANLDYRNYWDDQLKYYPDRLWIEDSERMSLIPHKTVSDTFRYRFENGVLSRYNDNIQAWIVMGSGDKTQIKYNMGYHKANYIETFENGGTMHYDIRTFDNEIATASGIYLDAHSLESLTQPTDTIMWCNIEYIYE